jgi:hypothetical protein
MSLIGDVKGLAQAYTPVFLFDVLTKDGVTHYWSSRAITWSGHPYEPIVADHSAFKIDLGIYGIEAVPEISLTLNNADTALNAIIDPANWFRAQITARFLFLNPLTGATTTDSKTMGVYMADMPSTTWPQVQFSAQNALNFARKTMPLSQITRRDRYPFPNDATERAAAFSDPTSPFYALGYSPDDGHGNYKNAPIGAPIESDYYHAADYNGTRDVDGDDGTVCLDTIGLGIRFGGFGKVPPPYTTTLWLAKGKPRATIQGSINDSKYGDPVPLTYGINRIVPPILDTGGPPQWDGARLTHLLLGDGINFASNESDMGIKGFDSTPDGTALYGMRVLLPDQEGKKYYEIPQASNDTSASGSWAYYLGAFGNQVLPGTGKYRNQDAGDFVAPDFSDRDPYSGLAFLAIGYPKELAQQDQQNGPKTEVIFKGQKVETWDVSASVTWKWSDNPVWIYIDLIKRLGYPRALIDEDVAFAAADYCNTAVDSLKPRFRCNLALMQKTSVSDLLRGVRNNCRMYSAYGSDGKLQIKIRKTYAAEVAAFALDDTNIVRDGLGVPMVKKFYKLATENANVFNVSFQDEDRDYVTDSLKKLDIDNVNDSGGETPGDSMTVVAGLPSYDQANRILNWLWTESVSCNEYYQVRVSMALIENMVGQVGTITEIRHSLVAQQCRIISMAPGPEGTIDLVLQKHSDAAYSDANVTAPLVRASADSSFSPRSAGGVSGATGDPTISEMFAFDEQGGFYRPRIQVDFSVPPTDYEGSFPSQTKITQVSVATTGGSLAGSQKLFVEIAPVLSGKEGLASNYILANIPAGTATNKIAISAILPLEADHYVVRVGSYPGRLFKLTSTVAPGTPAFSFNITTLAGLDSSSLSADPKFDHVRIFYRYNTDELHDAGATSGPGVTSFAFEPMGPWWTDTDITVIVCSSDAAENDFYPLDVAPSATLTLTRDSGNPSGASGLAIKTTTEDGTIPQNTMVFEWSRDTANFEDIYAAEVVMYSGATGQGPYSAQRTAFASHVHESGTGLAVVAGRLTLTIPSGGTDRSGKVFLINTDGADAGLDGNVIESHNTGTGLITLTSPFFKTGTFHWVIVDRWWDVGTSESVNLYEHTFWIPKDMLLSGVAAVWRTKPVQLLVGTYYANLYTRNRFGVSV